MERSVYSSTHNQIQIPHPLPSSFASADDDESGWTDYLEDDPSDAYSFGTSSLVSDAASHAAWNISNAVAHDPALPPTDHHNIPTKLTFKPKPPQFLVDTSLEDTASSPDNSPKVSKSGPFDTNNFRRKSSLGKGRTMADEANLQMGFKRKATGYTDLKRRGLCLVPLSVFTNYMGG